MAETGRRRTGEAEHGPTGTLYARNPAGDTYSPKIAYPLRTRSGQPWNSLTLAQVADHIRASRLYFRVLLANSARAELIYPERVGFILGDTTMPWWWEYTR